MADILQHKFRQNKDLYFKFNLINTRPYDLIEASMDGFWGTYCKLYSETQISGNWTGQNILGRLLVDLGTDLIRVEEAKRLHTPPRANPTDRYHNKQRTPTDQSALGHSPIQVDIQTQGANSTRLGTLVYFLIQEALVSVRNCTDTTIPCRYMCTKNLGQHLKILFPV